MTYDPIDLANINHQNEMARREQQDLAALTATRELLSVKATPVTIAEMLTDTTLTQPELTELIALYKYALALQRSSNEAAQSISKHVLQHLWFIEARLHTHILENEEYPYE